MIWAFQIGISYALVMNREQSVLKVLDINKLIKISYLHATITQGVPNNPDRAAKLVITSQCEGQDLGLARVIWTKLAASEMRLELLRELVKLGIGLNEIEDFCSVLKLHGGIVKEAMKLKLLDERKFSYKGNTLENQG